jgi:hypothetical protein
MDFLGYTVLPRGSLPALIPHHTLSQPNDRISLHGVYRVNRPFLFLFANASVVLELGSEPHLGFALLIKYTVIDVPSIKHIQRIWINFH